MTAFLGKTHQASHLALGLVLGLFLACTTSLGSARADDQPGWFTKALGLRTETPVSPPFVQQTRPAKADYVPVHTPRVGPKSQPMNKDQVANQEKSLEASRRTHDKIAERRSATNAKSVSDSMDQNAGRKRKPDACVGLTCANPSLLPAQPGREYR